MSFLEPLPEGCPPEDAEEITAERVVYRLVRTNPPAADDFRSHRAEQPVAHFRVPECIARGVSVHTERSDSEALLKLPQFRGRLVCLVNLEAGAGCMKQTSTPSHHTWWPLAAFDILGHCEVVP